MFAFAQNNMHYMHADMGNMDECLERALKRKVRYTHKSFRVREGLGVF